MTDQDLELFKKHLPLYECYKKHEFIRNYSKEVYTELIYLYTTYVNEKHSFSHWCSSCRVDLVVQLYGWYMNEENTTWYKAEKEEAEEVPFTTQEQVIENKPVRRRRKTK